PAPSIDTLSLLDALPILDKLPSHTLSFQTLLRLNKEFDQIQSYWLIMEPLLVQKTLGNLHLTPVLLGKSHLLLLLHIILLVQSHYLILLLHEHLYVQ